MNRTNKKGFTIVELVIVIAVIAILAAVLIPNLLRLVEKANESKALQEAESAMKLDLIEANGEYKTIAESYYKVSLTVGESATGYFTKSGEGESVSYADATGNVTENTTYYAKYQGTVNTEVTTYQYESDSYTSTFTIADGTWKVVKK